MWTLPDPVPYITRAHFEASMGKARRSVGPEIIEQYDEFTKKIKQQWSSSGAEGGSGNSYDIDAAKAEQEREDALLDGVDDEEEEENLVPAAGESDAPEAEEEQ